MLDESIKLSLSRFSQIYDTVNLDLSAHTDVFDDKQLTCEIVLETRSKEAIKVKVVASTLSDVINGCLHRVKRNIERKRKVANSKHRSQLVQMIEK